MRFITAAIIILFSANVLSAQKSVNPHFEAHHLDYRDLGYPGATEIPADNSPITSLITHSNGKIYGATSGKKSYLFVYDYLTNKVYPLGIIPESKGVHHSMVEGDDGKVYIGTGLNELNLDMLSKEVPHGRRSIEHQLWDDIKHNYEDYPGGHLFVYDPSIGDQHVYLPDDKAILDDLGIPAEGNSVYAMTIDSRHERIYGISYPDARFFEYDIQLRKFTDHGDWLKTKSYAGPERNWRSVPRSLVCLGNEKVVSSGDGGLIQYFDTNQKRIVSTSLRIPGEYWITQKYEGYPVVEQIFNSVEGNIYGSSSDGFIFRMNDQLDKLSVLGKPMVERRVRAMTLGADEKLYMICGQKNNVCRMFSYDLSAKNEGFRDYGVLGVDRSPYYAKIGYQFDAMSTGKDGSIYIGESDRRAKLFIYKGTGEIFPGVLNPTNPR